MAGLERARYPFLTNNRNVIRISLQTRLKSKRFTGQLCEALYCFFPLFPMFISRIDLPLNRATHV